MEEGGGLVSLISRISIRDYYQQYIDFLCLSHKESVIVSAVTPVHTWRRLGEIAPVPVFTRLPRTMGA